MKAEFWLDRWKNGQIGGFNQQEANAALRAHWPTLGVPAGARVFVPLCGKSIDMVWLRAQGHEVLGVELSRIAVRDFYAENGLRPEISPHGKLERWSAEGVTILCGDLFELTPDDLADVKAVYDRASLIALPRELRDRYAAKMRDDLPRDAQTLLVTLRYREGEMEGPPFSVDETEVRRLYAGAFDVNLLSSSDATADARQLRDRGVTSLSEDVFRLRRA